MTKVSVIIPSYGRPEFLKKSIQSVLEQSYQNWELLVVDDNGAGSPIQQETQKLIDQFKQDGRVQYLVLEKNKGGSAARNRGWKAANGEYLCFLDNDDEFYPKKLARQIQLLQSTGLNMTVCRFDSFKVGKKVRSSPLIKKVDDYLIPFAQGKINFASGSTLMVSKDLFGKVGGYDEAFRRKQDVELMIRLLAIEKLHVDDEVLVRLNIDDRANIPSVENFKVFQKIFNLKFKKLFETFPQEAQHQINQYELIELAKVALWNKDWRLFLRIYFAGGLKLGNQFQLGIDLARKFITYYLK